MKTEQRALRIMRYKLQPLAILSRKLVSELVHQVI